MFYCRDLVSFREHVPFKIDRYDLVDDTKRPLLGLIKAAREGSLSEVQYFLKMGVDPDSHYSETTPLIEAITYGHVNCVKALLSANADPNNPADDGVTPFMCAILCNDFNCQSLLMAHKHLMWDLTDHDNISPLTYTAQAGDFGLTKIIQGKIGENVHESRESIMETLIITAAANGQKMYLRHLVSDPSMQFSGAVMNAVARNDSDGLRSLVGDADFTPNVFCSQGLSPLILSCVLDHRECLDTLLEFKASVNHWDQMGMTALHYASVCGNGYCMEKLISNGAHISVTNRERENSLILAAKCGVVSSAEIASSALLLEREKLSSFMVVGSEEPNMEERFRATYSIDGEGEFLPSLEAVDHSYKTALMHASKRGHLPIVELLLEKGACVNTVSTHTGKDALMYASAYGHVDIVKKLLEAGASVNTKDVAGFSPLSYASSNGQISCIMLLLRTGARIFLDGHVREKFALFQALDGGHIECAGFLINAMTLEQLQKRDTKGGNAILCAAKNGNIAIIRLLLAAGLSLASVDSLGNNALMYATAGCYLDCMKFLVEDMGMSVNSQNYSGLNALAIAAFYDLPNDILNYLISAGSKVDAVNRQTGDFSLLFAIQNASERCFRILISAGANLTRNDVLGVSPMICASRSGNLTIFKLVMEALKDTELMVPGLAHKRSILFAVDRYHKSIVEEFLRMQLFDWSWYPCCMLNTRVQMRMLIKSLVTLGISPGHFIHEGQLSSPFTLALRYNDMPTAKYLIVNMYFTEEDYKNIRGNKDIAKVLKQNGDPAGRMIAKGLYSSPLSLSALSFLKVSSAIGQKCGLSGRRDAVNTLPIPDHFKRKLSFQEPTAQLCNLEWSTINLGHRICGYARREYGLFQKFVQRPQPFGSNFHPCVKNTLDTSICVCNEGGLSIFQSQRAQEKYISITYPRLPAT